MNKGEIKELAWVSAAIISGNQDRAPLKVEFDFNTLDGRTGLLIEHLKNKYPLFREEYEEWMVHYMEEVRRETPDPSSVCYTKKV